MRRAFIPLLVALAMAGGARAVPGGVILTQGSTFLPGDSGLPGAQPVVIAKGSDLVYTNVDQIGHSVTSVDKKKNGLPIFDSGVKGTLDSGNVVGVEKLDPGDYDFFCTVHPAMKGVLRVV